ncbi:MAG: hypothetical protein FWF59_10305 [Turicibacter sp.]|nr:hypothetical protein [Turicibacter sp.]
MCRCKKCGKQKKNCPKVNRVYVFQGVEYIYKPGTTTTLPPDWDSDNYKTPEEYLCSQFGKGRK